VATAAFADVIVDEVETAVGTEAMEAVLVIECECELDSSIDTVELRDSDSMTELVMSEAE
jgi:hypothetical protein